MHFRRDGGRAVLEVENLDVIDIFAFGNPAFSEDTSGTVSLPVKSRATGPAMQRGADPSVTPTDPVFLGQFVVAEPSL